MRAKVLMTFISIGFLIGLAGPAAAEEHEPAKPVSADGEEKKHVDEVKLTPEAIKKYDVKVGPVTKQMLTPTFVAPARVAFNAEAVAHVGAAVRGRAIEIKVRVGDIVKKGDELLIVESPELGQAQSDFIQKRTAVAVTLAGVEPAKNAYSRAKALYEKSEGIALGEVQKREADLKAAEGAHQTANAAMTAAENNLHLLGMDQSAVEKVVNTSEISPRYAIRAPLDGQVIEREVTLGELVSPEKEALLVIADMKTLWVLADVPEAKLKDVAIGAKARIQVGAVSKDVIEGKVALVSAALDPNTRTARIRIEVANSGNLRPGMFVTTEIAANSPSSPGTSVLAIPDEAVQTVEGQPAVFLPVKGEENTFAKRPVTVSKPVGGLVAVLSGLKEGEEIVMKGSFIFKAELGKGAVEE